MPPLLRILVVLAFAVVATLLGGLLVGMIVLAVVIFWLWSQLSADGSVASSADRWDEHPHNLTPDLQEHLDPANPNSPLGRQPIGSGDER